MSAPTKAQIREYGMAAGRACATLGIRSEEDRRSYRRLVVRELAGCGSIKDVRNAEAYDAVMARLWSDAEDYEKASHYRINQERKLAYVIRVLATQLMQLKGGAEAVAQAYIGGILEQSRISHGRSLSDGTYWMDVAPSQLSTLVAILDTERRRILRRHGATNLMSFTDKVRYEIDGPVLIRHGVAPGYYGQAALHVNVLCDK